MPQTKSRLDFDDSGFIAPAIDPETRSVYVFGPICEDVAAVFVPCVHELDRTVGDITVWVCSGGGDAYSGSAMFDALQGARNPTTVIGTGSVMSMAAVLLQAGKRRFMTPNTTYMLHNGTVGIGMNEPTKVMQAVQASQGMRERLMKHVSKRCKLTMRQTRAIFDRESWYDSHEALAAGLCDAILVKPQALKPVIKRPKADPAKQLQQQMQHMQMVLG